jgi:aspartate 1-decarboxylase
MLIKLLKAKIHRATITITDVDYVGSIAIDRGLLSEAGILPYEAVLVADVTNGARFETYVQPAEAGSGTICVNGAAAHLVSNGDLVIVFSFGYYEEADAKEHTPRVVFVDGKNRVTRVTGRR